MKKLLMIALLMGSAFVSAQNGQSTQIRSGSVLPATCDPTKGQVFSLVTGSTSVLYVCSATNTWTTLVVSAGAQLNVANIWTKPQTLGAMVAINSGTLQSAAALIPSGGTLLIGGPLTVATSYAAPANVAVNIAAGGSINVSSGQTLTINGPFTAPLTQVFTGSGTVSFAQGVVPSIYAGWWYSGSGAWDSALTAAFVACSAAVTWCDLPPVINTTAGLTVASDTLIRPLSWQGRTNASAGYGTVWTQAPTASGVDTIKSSGTNNVQIRGVFFIASNAGGYYPESAIYLNTVLGCRLNTIAAGQPFTLAPILVSGLQDCKMDEFNIANLNTTTATPAAIRFLGPGSTPTGALSTTTDISHLTVSGVAGTTGGLTAGIVFDGDGCFGCNLYSPELESIATNAINIGKGNTVDLYSPYTENVPNNNAAAGIFRIGEDYSGASYVTYVNLYGGEVYGSNGTYTNVSAFDLGPGFNRVTVNQGQFGRVDSFIHDGTSGGCSTCTFLVAGTTVNGLGTGFGTITLPQMIDFRNDNKFSGASPQTAAPSGSRQQGDIAFAPPFYLTPGQMYLTTNYGPIFWREQYGTGATVSITASGGIISAATISGGTLYAVNDVLNVTQGGGTGGQVVVSTVSSGVPSAITILNGGSGYTTASGLATVGTPGIWVNASGSSQLGSSALVLPIVNGLLTINETTYAGWRVTGGSYGGPSNWLSGFVDSNGGGQITATNELFLKAGGGPTVLTSSGANGVYVNYDPVNGGTFGTGGFNVGDGAGNLVAWINSIGSIYFGVSNSGADFFHLVGTATGGRTITFPDASGTVPVTGLGVNALIQNLTGCNTATYVYTPQASDCVASGGGLPTLPTSPNSVPQTLTSTPSGGVGGAAVWSLSGVAGRTVSGASDTVAATDRASWIVYNYASAVAASLPSAASLGSNFVFGVKNIGAGAVTITPTTSTIDGSSTLVVAQGQNCTITSLDNTNYVSRCAATVMPASLTTTAATSDNVTIQGMTSSGHCSVTPTNASAATNLATTYVSAKTTNQITVTHTATASMNYDILCTPN